MSKAPAAPAPPSLPIELKRKRVSRACGPCKHRKTKCSADLPCKHCVETGDVCYYPQVDPYAAATAALASANSGSGHASDTPQQVLDRLERLEQTFASIGISLYSKIDHLDGPLSARPAAADHTETSQSTTFADAGSSTHADDAGAADGLHKRAKTTHAALPQAVSPSQALPETGLQILEHASPVDLQQHRVDRKGTLRFLGPGCSSSLQAELSIAQSADRDVYESSKRAPAPYGIFWTPETGLESLLAQLPAEPLPPDSLIQELLNRFFTSFFPILPIIDSATVDSLTRVVRETRNAHADPRGAAILYMIMACSLRIRSTSYASQPYESINSADPPQHLPGSGSTGNALDSYTCFQRAKRYFLQSGEQATIIEVQFYGLTTFYHVCVNAAARAWVIAGHALRLAIDLGLHVSSRNFKSSVREHRRRVFWSLYSMENLLGSNLGRPVTLPEKDITQEFPDTCVSGEDLSGFLHILRVQRLIAVARITTLHFQQSSGAEANHLRDQITGYLQDLQSWYADAPPLLNREYQYLSRPERSLKLIMDDLHRSTCLMLSLPFLPRRSEPSTQHGLLALSRCMTAARDIIKAAGTITLDVPASHYLFSATQYLNAAGALFLLLFYQGQADSHTTADAVRDVESCIKALEDLQTVFPGASAALGFLANMYEKVMASKVAQVKQHNSAVGASHEPVRMTFQAMSSGHAATSQPDGANQAIFSVVPHSPLFVTEAYHPGPAGNGITRPSGTDMPDESWLLPDVLVPFGRTFDNVNLDFEGLEELFTGQSMHFDSMAQWPLFSDIPDD